MEGAHPPGGLNRAECADAYAACGGARAWVPAQTSSARAVRVDAGLAASTLAGGTVGASAAGGRSDPRSWANLQSEAPGRAWSAGAGCAAPSSKTMRLTPAEEHSSTMIGVSPRTRVRVKTAVGAYAATAKAISANHTTACRGNVSRATLKPVEAA